MESVYLCHKCSGLLTTPEDTTTNYYSCNCISGYVRDWQPSIPLHNVRGLQIVAQLEWLALYKSQGRPDNDYNVIRARETLARLQQ